MSENTKDENNQKKSFDEIYLRSRLNEIGINFCYNIALFSIVFLTGYVLSLSSSLSDLYNSLLNEFKTPNIIMTFTPIYGIFIIFIFISIVFTQNKLDTNFDKNYKILFNIINTEKIAIEQKIEKLNINDEEQGNNINNEISKLKQKAKEYDEILQSYANSALQAVDNYWLFKYRINKFCEYINISLLCMIVNTWAADSFKSSFPVSNFIVVILNHFIVGLLPLTSASYKNHKKYRKIVAVLWVSTIFLFIKHIF